MQSPAYKVKIGSATYDSSRLREIISIYVDLDMDVPLDRFKITLMKDSKSSSIKKGDPVQIELGYDGALNKVLTGTVNTVEPKISEVIVSGFSLMSLLTDAKINQVYENQSAGAMVKDMAGRAGLAVKEASDGISFPMYSIDDSKNVYTHIHELAQLCGFDLYLTGDGKLVFKKYERKTPRPFKYGRDVLEAEANELTPPATSVKVYGESPSSFKGANTSHLKSKKVVEGIAGNGGTVLTMEDARIRDKDTADKVAVAKLESLMTPLKGTIRSLGNTRVAPGDTIEIKEMPDSRINGEFEVRSMSHIFSGAEGLITTAGWIKKVSISPSEPALMSPPAVPAPPKPPSPLEEELKKAQGAMEESRLKLMDAVESGEAALEGMLAEINNAISEMDKRAEEMIKAAEEAKNTALEAAREALKKADELKKELEAQKKKIQDAIDEKMKKFEEYKKEAMAQADKYAGELTKLKEEGKKLADQASAKVEDVKKKVAEKQKELEDALNKAKEKMDETIRQARDKKKELEDAKGSVTGEVEGVGVADKAKIPDMEKEIGRLEKEAEDLKKEIDEKQKAIEDVVSGVSEKAEEIEKEVREKIADIDNKVKEIEGKAEEVKKGIDDAEKELKGYVDEAKKNLDEITKEIQEQIDEAKKMAEDIVKEAEEKYSQSVKKAEEAKKEAMTSLEKVKKSYNEARDKVIEAKKMAGLE
ncbi:hypothetical protein CUJ83_04855 [Methanocella sp. CWC-04]|uniref:Phage protein D n=1 Tax=Methanooceanicella nereidis TaxID=2052831 RepID=A0AAP2W5P9_9EURY|nr:hypothetical protein [Methanocella sp. CWC-04]MCD1294327.1 hypothetical protein [Methanocella sp. CWC-04]